MKQSSVYFLCLCSILLLFSCDKKEEKIQETYVQGCEIDMSRFTFDHNDQIVLTATYDEQSKGILLSEKNSRYNQFIPGGQVLRLNWTRQVLQSNNYKIKLEAIRREAPGGCNAYYLTRLPHDLYSHVSGWRYIRKQSSTVGPNADSWICGINGGEYAYTSRRYRSCSFHNPDVTGYSAGGFTIDNNGWGLDPDSEVNIVITK